MRAGSAVPDFGGLCQNGGAGPRWDADGLDSLRHARLLGNDVIPALQILFIEDSPVLEMISNYVDKNRGIYGQIAIPCPVIENTDEVRNMLLSGNKAIAKIVSSTGTLVLQCSNGTGVV